MILDAISILISVALIIGFIRGYREYKKRGIQ